MKIGQVVITIFSIILISCGGNNTTESIVTENVDQKIAINAKTIEGLEYTDYALSAEGEKATTDWDKYKELAIQIGYLKKGDLSFFNGDKEPLKKFINEFRIGIPDLFRTNPIVSRTVIIETTLLKLNENLTLTNIDARAKLSSIKEILVAFSNLNYQINKKLERDVYDRIESE